MIEAHGSRGERAGGFRRPSVDRELQLGPRLFRGGGEAELRRYRELNFSFTNEREFTFRDGIAR
jgi:hypothetical protein